jgi:hypothetical protein
MKKTLAVTILGLCFLGGCTESYSGKELPYENEFEREEYRIYSLGIEHVYLDNLLSSNRPELTSIVVISETNDLNEYWLDKLTGDIDAKGIPVEAIESWRAENRSTKVLRRKFDLSYEYRLVSRSELDKLDQVNFFGEFYERYPGSNGLMSFSKIGFDRAGTTALIHVIHSYGTFGASYNFIMLEKVGGVWNVVRKIPTSGS